jgi:hypothetical protein
MENYYIEEAGIYITSNVDLTQILLKNFNKNNIKNIMEPEGLDIFLNFNINNFNNKNIFNINSLDFAIHDGGGTVGDFNNYLNKFNFLNNYIFKYLNPDIYISQIDY